MEGARVPFLELCRYNCVGEHALTHEDVRMRWRASPCALYPHRCVPPWSSECLQECTTPRPILCGTAQRSSACTVEWIWPMRLTGHGANAPVPLPATLFVLASKRGQPRKGQ
eukprot:5642880-Pleurochrysis_carterae.AAC.2